MQKRVEEKLSDVASLIFTAHLLILKDKEFTGRMEKLITAGEAPPDAIIKIVKKYLTLFSLNPNPYIQEKVQDLKDLAVRLMGNLVSEKKELSAYEGRIVIAKELFPSDILKMSSEKVNGIILATGGVTSHLSILARSLQIPMVISDVPELLRIPYKTNILLDAEVGNIYLNPSEEIVLSFKDQNKGSAHLKRQKHKVQDITKTKDGTRVSLLANINLLSDLTLAQELHIEGVLPFY